MALTFSRVLATNRSKGNDGRDIRKEMSKEEDMSRNMSGLNTGACKIFFYCT